MTSPVIVGEVAVEVTARAGAEFTRALRRSINRAVKEANLGRALTAGLTKALRDADLGKALQDALPRQPIKVPVQPTTDDGAPTDRPRAALRQPRQRQQEPDLLLRAFQQDVQRQLRALARQAVAIPLRPDTETLRDGIAQSLEEIRRRVKAEVPVEPADRRAYEQRLRQMLAEVGERVRMALPAPEVKPPKPVPVPLEPLTAAFQRDVRLQVARLARQVQATIPVNADTEELRRRLGAQLAEIQRQSRLTVPVDPGSRQAYEARLRAMLAAVQRSIPPVRTELRVDVDRPSLRQATSALSGLASAARGVVGAAAGLAGIGAVVGAGATALAGLASAAGAAIQLLGGLAAAAITASGALAALPGAASIAAAAVGALVLGFAGISDAVKESVKSSDAASRARSGLAAAERAYQAALRESQRAQENLNRARRQAVERIEDLGRALRGAQLDEREAALRLIEAERDLAQARRTGTYLDIQRAQLAYEQAQLAVENTRDATEDLAAEQEEAARKGVEGSDEVQAALDRQMAAADSLAAAQERLAQAQLGAAGGSSAAAAAMARLAPAAREVVRAVLALRPAWEEMQRAVQQTLLTGVAADLTRLSDSVLPTLRDGFVGVAEVLNTQLRSALQELGSATSRVRLGEIFGNTEATLANFTSGIKPLIRALLDLTAVGAEVVAEITKGAGDAIKRFSDQISAMSKSGELKQLINDGIDTLKQFGRAAADVFGIVKGIFSAAGTEGGGLFAMLDRLNKLVNSIEGQQALSGLFNNLSKIGDALLPVLLTIGQALGPVSLAVAVFAEAFSPTLQSLVENVANALVNLLPAAISLIPAVETLGNALAPLSRIIADIIVGAAPGLNALLQGLVGGLQALAPAAAPVGQALGAIAQALAPLLPLIGQQLANVLTLVATLFAGVASEMGPLIGVVAEAGAAFTAQFLPVIQQLAERLLPVMADAGARIAEAFRPLIPVVAEIGRIIAERLSASLPRLVGAFERLLPSVIRLAEAFGMALLDALEQLLPHLPGLIDAGLDLALAFTDLFLAVAPFIPDLLELGLLLATAALNSGVLQLTIESMTLALTLAGGAIKWTTGLLDAIRDALGKVRDAAGRMGSAVADGAKKVYDKIREIPGKITSALGDLGNLLYRAGQRVIEGLINGIYSMFGALRSAASSIAGTIRDYLPFSPAKRGPLSGRGNPLYSGRSIARLVAEGVRDNLGIVADAADSLAYQFAGPVAASVPALDGLTPAGLSTPAPASLVAEWVGGDGDPIIRAIREHVRIYYDGSAQRAIGTGVR